MTVGVAEWLGVIRREYLENFINGGGAAVKFVVLNESAHKERFISDVGSLAKDLAYEFTALDAVHTKVHMIDRVFHAVAKQIDWNGTAHDFLVRVLRENGWSFPESPGRLRLEEIAVLNAREVDMIRPELRTLLERQIYRDYKLAQEFRIAMIRLCQAQIEPVLNASPALADGIQRWLKGELTRISELRDAPIFQRVTRHNGRHMLMSLSRWLNLAGRAGLVLLLDIERCFMMRPRPRDVEDTSVYYTPAAIYDAYEAFRELVDETDDLEHCLVVVLASPEFLDHMNRRSVWGYDALRLRIWDEVRDEQRPNPLSGLVRLTFPAGA
jgi:hypothetical protein